MLGVWYNGEFILQFKTPISNFSRRAKFLISTEETSGIETKRTLARTLASCDKYAKFVYIW